MSNKEISRVVYKPDSQSTEEYILIINKAEYTKYKDGDTTIPLADVVDSFQVFQSGQGKQGILNKPSKQELENIFGSSKDIDVVTFMLEKGTVQAGDAISNKTFGSTNASRGGNVDVRGGQRTTGV